MIIAGECRVVDNPKNTEYFWGDISEISGKFLRCIEKNRSGDCLCVNGKGLIDVDKNDVAEFKAD